MFQFISVFLHYLVQVLVRSAMNQYSFYQSCDRDHGLETWSALEFILSRSRSRDLMAKVLVLVSRQHVWCLRL